MAIEEQLEDDINIDLKNRGVAALLAWLVPGMGHMYQGRISKGITIFVSVSFLFIVGLQMGGGKVVYCSLTKADFRWQFFGQAFLGSAAIPAVIQNRAVRDYKDPYLGGRFAPPVDIDERREWLSSYHAYFDIGTLYTLIAGVLNMFAIFDAYGGPAVWYQNNEDEDPELSEGGAE